MKSLEQPYHREGQPKLRKSLIPSPHIRNEGMPNLTVSNSSSDKVCAQCPAHHISLCSQLNLSDLDHLAHVMTKHQKAAKQVIFSEDQEAEFLYNIRSGSVLTSKMLPDGRRQITGFLFAGDIFGSLSHDDDTYNYTTETLTPVEICRFPRTKMAKIFQDLPQLEAKTFDMTRNDLKSAYDQIMLLGRKTATEKLCSFLLLMKKKINRSSGNTKDTLYLPMKRLDIADFLGLTIETISRQFAKLTSLDLIALDGPHTVHLKDIKTLLLLAQGDKR